MSFLSRRNKVKGMSARVAFELPSGQAHVAVAQADMRKPACSKGHPANRMVKEVEGWVCLVCFDEFLKEHNPGGIHNRTKGGVVVPKGTKNPDGLLAADILPPNRAARRRARRNP